MNVNKNVTFDYQHFQMILAVKEKEQLPSFSSALKYCLNVLIMKQKQSDILQKQLLDVTQERDTWKERANVETGAKKEKNSKEVL